MSDAVLMMLALAVAITGMAAFALANVVHWRQLLGARQQTVAVRTGCKFLGTVLVGTSFGLCVLADPITMAILVWPMLLGIATAIVAAFVTAWARHRAQNNVKG